MLKNLSLIILFLAVLSSCTKKTEDPAPVADFTVTVSGQSPSATLQIVNNSTNAATYSWTFGKGASVATSTDKVPAGLKVDKAGQLTVTLVATNGTLTSTKTVQVAVAGNSAVVSYTDLEFSLTAGSTTYGRLFSFDGAGKMYKDSEINATVAPTLHLAFGTINSSILFFDSPTATRYNVTGATVTNVMNFLSPSPISLSAFDTIVDDSSINSLVITNSMDSFGVSNASSGNIILFQLASGRKGVVKTKAINAARILVDIKIQKY